MGDWALAAADDLVRSMHKRALEIGFRPSNRLFQTNALREEGGNRGGKRATRSMGVLRGDARCRVRPERRPIEKDVSRVRPRGMAALDEDSARTKAGEALGLQSDLFFVFRNRFAEERCCLMQVRRDKCG